MEAVEACGDAFQIFAGESRDQIGVEVNGGHRAEGADVLLDFFRIHSALNARGDIGVKRLYADFELEEAGGRLREDGFEFVGKHAGFPFEMEHHAVNTVFEEKVQYLGGVGGVGVEAAVDELENPSAAFNEFSKHWKKVLRWEKPNAVFEGGKAVFAGEGASARAFDVETAVGEVFVRVFIVGKGNRFQVGGRCIDYFG